MTNAAIDQKATEIFTSLFSPKTDPVISLTGLDSDTCKLILTAADDKYYASLEEKYKKLNLEDAKNNVDDMDNELGGYDKDAEAKKKEGETDSDKLNVGTNIKATKYTGTKFTDTDIITTFASCIGDLIQLNGNAARDTIYATVYAMNMFSYRTFVYERKAASYNGEITLANCDEIYSSLESEWKNEDKKYTYNKSLTNHLINSSNNAAYTAEIEFILYGGQNKDNLKKAYNSIYALRYAFNIASAFVNFYNPTKNATAESIEIAANLVASLTSGIIPPPVTKCVIIALLTALESVHDMQVLNKGLKLSVYKMDHTEWAYSIPSPSGTKVSPKPDDNKASGGSFAMSYSDYMFMFLFCAFNKTTSNLSKAAYYRMGLLIQENMKKVTGNSKYDLSKAKTMFTFTTELKVEPLMLDLPLASDYTGNLSDASGWNKYSIEVSRGY